MEQRGNSRGGNAQQGNSSAGGYGATGGDGGSRVGTDQRNRPGFSERRRYSTENWSDDRQGRGYFPSGMEWFPEDEDTGEVIETWRNRGYGGTRGIRNNDHYAHGNPGGVGHSYGEGWYGVNDNAQRQGGEPQRDRGPRVWPKGYQRSDERIREDLCEQLSHARHADIAQISVDVAGGVVTLSGTVSDRRVRRLAEEIADEIGGVSEIRNDIRVTR